MRPRCRGTPAHTLFLILFKKTRHTCNKMLPPIEFINSRAAGVPHCTRRACSAASAPPGGLLHEERPCLYRVRPLVGAGGHPLFTDRPAEPKQEARGCVRHLHPLLHVEQALRRAMAPRVVTRTLTWCVPWMKNPPTGAPRPSPRWGPHPKRWPQRSACSLPRRSSTSPTSGRSSTGSKLQNLHHSHRQQAPMTSSALGRLAASGDKQVPRLGQPLLLSCAATARDWVASPWATCAP